MEKEEKMKLKQEDHTDHDFNKLIDINEYNDLSAIFSNHNNNNNHIIFGNTNCNIFDVVTSSHDQIGANCSYLSLHDDLSGVHDLGSGVTNECSLLDLVHRSSGPGMARQASDPSLASSVIPAGDSSSEVVISGPATPNSISISSSSSEAPNDGPPKDDGEHRNKDEEYDNKSKKQLKAKKKEKKEKEPRFAFMTKSDVDHLDDGYRWRKYGQKAVKNSPFPRSYYRCTTAACGVKKRVERSSEDPSIVVTAYEGQHTHPCPIMTRSGFGLGLGIGGGVGIGTESYLSQPLDQCSTAPIMFGGRSAATSSSSLLFPYPHNHFYQQQFHKNYTQFLNPNFSSSLSTFTFKDSGSGGDGNPSIISSLATTISSSGDATNLNLQRSNTMVDRPQHRHIRPSCSASSTCRQFRDDGLLQDMIMPSQLQNDATKEE